jgi:hypothetical protein
MSSSTEAAAPAAAEPPAAASRVRRPGADFKTWAAILVAVIAIAGFALTVWYLLASAHSSTDSSWQRLTYVFSGVQTVVFTAVGWLFGREVNRRQADTAQQRADTASEAEKAALAKAADMEARGKAAKAALAARKQRGGASGDIDELVAFMNSLFPG